jgi:hypothetical protein
MTTKPLLEQSSRIALAGILHDLGKFAERAKIPVNQETLDANKQLYCPHRKKYVDDRGWFSHVYAAYTGLAMDLIEDYMPELKGADFAPFGSGKPKRLMILLSMPPPNIINRKAFYYGLLPQQIAWHPVLIVKNLKNTATVRMLLKQAKTITLPGNLRCSSKFAWTTKPNKNIFTDTGSNLYLRAVSFPSKSLNTKVTTIKPHKMNITIYGKALLKR